MDSSSQRKTETPASDEVCPAPADKNISGEHWRWGPRCGHELINEKCKLRCPRVENTLKALKSQQNGPCGLGGPRSGFLGNTPFHCPARHNPEINALHQSIRRGKPCSFAGQIR